MNIYPWLYRVKVKGEDAMPNGGMNEFDIFPNYLATEKSQILFQRCKDEIPFGTVKWNGLIRLPILSFGYGPYEEKPKIAVLDELIAKLQNDYFCRVEYVWCNLFEDGKHHIGWHQDQYGSHCFVLSLGSRRKVMYRKKKGIFSAEKVLVEHTMTRGDLYYFSPIWDSKTEHCVPRMKDVTDPRISLVFFVSRPFATSKETSD